MLRYDHSVTSLPPLTPTHPLLPTAVLTITRAGKTDIKPQAVPPTQLRIHWTPNSARIRQSKDDYERYTNFKLATPAACVTVF
ncbi:hypothetical protein BaRGS_00024205 [Batillaria attramentaria]|uniref:Uncharacterized protein n=1 Tax=Batillaria attramentaria TaxID=370345 RepID=A0ABD0KBU6_9CAEN